MQLSVYFIKGILMFTYLRIFLCQLISWLGKETVCIASTDPPRRGVTARTVTANSGCLPHLPQFLRFCMEAFNKGRFFRPLFCREITHD